MSRADQSTGLQQIFGSQKRAELASALQHYMLDILSSSEVQEETALDCIMRCRELGGATYSQALRFLDLLDSRALSPAALQAVRNVLLEAKAGHLLNGGSGKLHFCLYPASALTLIRNKAHFGLMYDIVQSLESPLMCHTGLLLSALQDAAST